MRKCSGNQIKFFMAALMVPDPFAQFPSCICIAERMGKKAPSRAKPWFRSLIYFFGSPRAAVTRMPRFAW